MKNRPINRRGVAPKVPVSTVPVPDVSRETRAVDIKNPVEERNNLLNKEQELKRQRINEKIITQKKLAETTSSTSTIEGNKNDKETITRSSSVIEKATESNIVDNEVQVIPSWYLLIALP